MSSPKSVGSASVTYSLQYRRCGKASCPSCTPPARGHGPYWYAFWWEAGRVRSRYLGKEAPRAEPVLQALPSPAPASALKVRTLGSFAVWRSGELLPAGQWGRRKVAAMFKALLSAPHYRLHREQLLDVLYPEAVPDEPAKGLRSVTYLLRKILDEPWAAASHLQSQGALLVLMPTVSGEPEADWLDAVAFEQEATAALNQQDMVRCRAALSLYGGEYLPEDRYEVWAEQRRESLRSLHVELLLHLAHLSAAAHEVEETLRCLRTVLVENPCHEDAARELMQLLAAEGRRGEAMEVYRALGAALEREVGEAPSQQIREIRARLPGGVPLTLLPPSRRTNLPEPLTSFVGREWERSELMQALRAGVGGSRLLTLVGPGGCGKTRLALEVARGLGEDYADGTFLVELARVTDPERLPEAVADALGLREQVQGAGGHGMLEAVSGFLAPKQLLLVLDNCEHLPADCARLAVTLLQRAAGLRLLATSQATLGVLGETVYRVPSLSLPETEQVSARELAAHEAVQLFVERAQAVRPGFILSDRNAAAVSRICRQLDGMPLAIELAAARLALLSVEQIAARLDDRFALLREGNRTALPRQQTLQATIEWSYNLLMSREQVLLRRLAVFSGGWLLEAAEAVCPGEGLSRHTVVDRLGALVSKSLVQVVDAGENMRYRLLETVRHYARAQLRAAGEEEALRRRHARWCQFVAEAAEQGLVGPDQGDWLARLECEHDNMRAALRWTLECEEAVADTGAQIDLERHEIAARLAAGLWRFWLVRGHVTEGRSWLDRLLRLEFTAPVGERALQRAALFAAAAVLATEQGDHKPAATLAGSALALYREAGDARHSAATLSILATTAMRQGDSARAAALYEESLAIFRGLDEQRSIAMVLNNLGLAARYQGDSGRAAALYEESLAIKQSLGDVHGIAVALNNLGDVALDTGDVSRAHRLFERSLAMFQEQKGQWGIALLLTNLGNVARAEHDYAQAVRLYQKSLIMYRDMDNRVDVSECLVGLAAASYATGELHRAALLLGAAASTRAPTDMPLSPRDRTDCEQTSAALRAALGNPAFEAAWTVGMAMTLGDAMTFALGGAAAGGAG